MRRTLKALSLMICGALVAPFVYAQAVNLQGEARLKLASVGGVRTTNPDFVQAFEPEWQDPPDTSITTKTIELTEDVVGSFDFNPLLFLAEHFPAGTKSYSTVSGSPPTGMTLTGATGVVAGTPTTVQSVQHVIRGTFTPTSGTGGAADLIVTWNIIAAPDTTPPPVPQNLTGAPTTGAETSSISWSWDAVVDPQSGLSAYRLRWATTANLCLNGPSSMVQVTAPATTTTVGGLAADSQYFAKVSALDVAGNQSPFTACVQASTAPGGGGGGGVGSIIDEDWESGVINGQKWNESSNCSSGDCCVPTIQTGGAAEGSKYLRSILTANPPNGGSYRCEQNAIGIGTSTQLNTVYFYGLSLRVPASFANDSQADDTIMQLHHQPITNPNCHHMIRIENNVVNFNSNGCGSIGGPGATLMPLVKNQWNRFCVRAVWAINASGSLKVWVNPSSESSTPVYQFSGQTLPTAYTNIAKFKLGLYKTKWRTNNFPNPFNSATSPRIIEHDDVRVGATFAEACQ